MLRIDYLLDTMKLLGFAQMQYDGEFVSFYDEKGQRIPICENEDAWMFCIHLKMVLRDTPFTLQIHPS